MDISAIHSFASRLRENIEKVIVGRREVINITIASLIAGGHVLLEDMPGTGKTMLAKALAASLGAGFKRVQFTPDLLPGDITGTNVYNQKESEFNFRPGPAFTNILLADEINRATPRTQSALLECMEEGQISSDGVTYKIKEPFFVIATQNPIETQGTFPLPEAQLDRFLVRLSMGYPDKEEALSIMERFITSSPLIDLKPAAGIDELIAAKNSFSSVYTDISIREYIAQLTEATRNLPDITIGISPRGMLALLRLSQAYAAVSGRDFVIPDDIKTLIAPVFLHRLRGNSLLRLSKTKNIIKDLLNKVPVPTEDMR